MGYLLVRKNLEDWRDELEKIASTQLPCAIATKNPRELAYSLRQARAVARKYKDPIWHKIAHLKFRETKTTLLVEPKATFDMERELIRNNLGPPEPGDLTLAKEPMIANTISSTMPVTFPTASTPLEVVGILQDIAPQIQVVVFPDFLQDLVPIQKWCEAFELFTITNELPLTLTRNKEES